MLIVPSSQSPSSSRSLRAGADMDDRKALQFQTLKDTA